jgi:hypothetical protein
VLVVDLLGGGTNLSSAKSLGGAVDEVEEKVEEGGEREKEEEEEEEEEELSYTAWVG